MVEIVTEMVMEERSEALEEDLVVEIVMIMRMEKEEEALERKGDLEDVETKMMRVVAVIVEALEAGEEALVGMEMMKVVTEEALVVVGADEGLEIIEMEVVDVVALEEERMTIMMVITKEALVGKGDHLMVDQVVEVSL